MKEVSMKLILILSLALAACSSTAPQMKTVMCDVDGDGVVEPVGLDVRALDQNGDVKMGDRVLHCATTSPATNTTSP